MARLSEDQVAQLWVKHGGPEEQAAMAVAVSNHESGRDPSRVNSASGATGLMQIHPGGEQYKDPDVNMQTAVAKWRDRGWIPWSVCGAGAWSAGTRNCEKLQPEANRIAGRLGKKAGIFDLPIVPQIPGAPGGPNPGNPFGGIPGLEALGNLSEVIRGAFETWLEILKKIADPNTWKDAGKILLGLILLKIGLTRLFQVVT